MGGFHDSVDRTPWHELPPLLRAPAVGACRYEQVQALLAELDVVDLSFLQELGFVNQNVCVLAWPPSPPATLGQHACSAVRHVGGAGVV